MNTQRIAIAGTWQDSVLSRGQPTIHNSPAVCNNCEYDRHHAERMLCEIAKRLWSYSEQHIVGHL
ncbi:MAG: hypothetical protein QGG54_19600 [Gammaproteobacteria bacterium]|nr:hypothetical protein [Gammaproteobacteria bacterium]